jgi:hypothetical protein
MADMARMADAQKKKTICLRRPAEASGVPRHPRPLNR